MIAVCGECLIDFIPDKSKSPSPNSSIENRLSSNKKVTLPYYQSCIGGSPLNTAVAISRLTTPVTMISRLSRDAFGVAIEKHLSLNQVGTKTLSHGEEPTTIGFVIPKKNRGEDFVFYAQKSADRFIKIKDLPTPLPARVRHLHFSSIALQMEPCGKTYEYLMRREYRHRTISLDPNVRALFIQNREEYLGRVERMATMVGVFRASDQDLKYLYPQLSPGTAIKRILPRLRAPQVAVLTEGVKGATVFYCNHSGSIEKLYSPIKKGRVIDTVGAGDSFTGAFLHTLYRHRFIANINIGKKKSPSPSVPIREILKEALDFSIQAAALNCSRKGCDPAFLQELETR